MQTARVNISLKNSKVVMKPSKLWMFLITACSNILLFLVLRKIMIFSRFYVMYDQEPFTTTWGISSDNGVLNTTILALFIFTYKDLPAK